MRFKTGRWLRGLTAVLACVTLWAAGTPLEAVAAQDIGDQQKALEQKLAQANQKMKELAGQEDRVKDYIDAIDDKIDLAQQNLELLAQKQKALDEELSALNREIATVSEQVEKIEKEIHIKQLSFNDRYRSFEDRLYAMYVSGTPSTLEAFLSAEDFSGFLMSAELLSSVSKADREALEDLIGQMEDIRSTQNTLNEKKQSLSQRQTELHEKKNELEAAKEKNEKAKQAYAKEERDANKRLEELGQKRVATQEDMDNLEKNIQDAIEEANRKEEEANKPGKPSDPGGPEKPDTPTPPSSTGMTWPAPQCPYITTYFDPNGVNGRRHRGVDLASAGSAMGKPIVAADSGEVIYTDVGGWGDSYGSYMMVRHSNGLTTLYAHCSEVWVKKGQKVKKGEQIGRVGNTGNSRGAHLHFEVRDRTGSGRLNPLNYIKWGR